MAKKYCDYSAEEKILHSQRVLRWRKANPEKVRAWEASIRSRRTKKPRGRPRKVRTEAEDILRTKHKSYSRVGISLDLVNQILAAQGGKCAICERELDILHSNNSLKCPNVDHCHITMKIRGVLCRPCNQWLGLYETNKAFLQKSDTYLDNRPQWGDLK
jgi:hypothetical protein